MMRGMMLVADLFPAEKVLSDPTARAKLAVLRTALAGGDLLALDAEQHPLAQRIDQAAQKIDSGAEIARISELMTLAQFGPGSIGSAIAHAHEDDAAAPVAEALLVARFLIEAIFAAPRSPNLLPGDRLKEFHLNRADVSWPAAAPVYGELLARAAATIERADGLDIRISSPALRKMLARHRLQTVSQIHRLRGRDPALPGTRLTGFDNLMISLKLLLRLRGAP